MVSQSFPSHTTNWFGMEFLRIFRMVLLKMSIFSWTLVFTVFLNTNINEKVDIFKKEKKWPIQFINFV